MTISLHHLFHWLATTALILGALTGVAIADNFVAHVPTGDPAMLAAFKQAAAGFDDFLAKWRHPPVGASNFAIKIGLQEIASAPGYVLVKPGADGDDSKVEWFWIGAVRGAGDGIHFSGRIDNAPTTVKTIHSGDLVSFTRDYVGDWMYLQNGKIVGNATACPALVHASDAERGQIRDLYGLNCI